MVVCPVYEDPEDQKLSIFNLENVSPLSWSWLSTLNRVNSQVQKESQNFCRLASISYPSMLKFTDACVCLCHYTREPPDAHRCTEVARLLGAIFRAGSSSETIHPCSHAGMNMQFVLLRHVPPLSIIHGLKIHVG